MAPAKRDLAQHVPDGKPLVCFRGVAQRVGRGDRNLESGRLDGESQVLELADTRDGVEVVMVTTPSNDIVPKSHGIGDLCIRRHRGRNYADEPPAIPDRPVSAHGMTAKPFQRIVIDNF